MRDTSFDVKTAYEGLLQIDAEISALLMRRAALLDDVRIRYHRQFQEARQHSDKAFGTIAVPIGGYEVLSRFNAQVMVFDERMNKLLDGLDKQGREYPSAVVATYSIDPALIPEVKDQLLRRELEYCFTVAYSDEVVSIRPEPRKATIHRDLETIIADKRAADEDASNASA